MLQPRRSSFVCWRCLTRNAQLGRLPHPQPQALRLHYRPHRTASSSSVEPNRGQEHEQQDIDFLAPGTAVAQNVFRNVRSARSGPGDGDSEPAQESGIRGRLRQWDAENPQSKIPALWDAWKVSSPEAPTSARNMLTHTEVLSNSDLLEPDAHDELDREPPGAMYEPEDQPLSAGVQPGDLIEVTQQTSRGQVLAICVGRLSGRDHFYASTGQWFFSSDVNTNFRLRGFASQEEIAPIFDALPPEDTTADVLHELKLARQGPSREVGMALIRKMNAFAGRAAGIRQRHARELDTAHSVIGPSGIGFITAHEAAEMVLPDAVRDEEGKLPDEVAYAVYLAMAQDDTSFRRFGRAVMQFPTCLFEVIPPQDVATIKEVQEMVRRFGDSAAEGVSASAPQGTRAQHPRDDDAWLEKSRLGRFLLRARRQIDHSRQARGAHSPAGLLKPVHSPVPVPAPGNGWLEDEDRVIVRFLHLWAVNAKFNPSSHMHGIGATILKGLDRYQHSKLLERGVAWLFLQEVGWVLPWDVPSRHIRPPPGVVSSRVGTSRLAGYPKPPAEPLVPAKELRRDTFPGTRRDWAGARVFCIDSADTVDVDDGLSVERTDVPGQYWIHVHVADPASALRPDAPAAKYAEAVSRTSYLSGHFEPMFPDRSVRDSFSLAPGRRCLTFSAKLDDQGTLLDYGVSAGKLGDVVYMTYDELSTLCPPPATTGLASRDRPLQAFSVGEPPAEASPQDPSRRLTKASELLPQDVDDIELLSRLSLAVSALKKAKGAVPHFRERATASVSHANTQTTRLPDGTVQALGEPYYRIFYEASTGHPVVSMPMQLAGEVAGRWCRDRGVPLPYRTLPQAQLNIRELTRFSREVMYPKLVAGQDPTPQEWEAWRLLNGFDGLSAEPEPYHVIGADLYVKATSPLRRYGDLLAHWQIHAVLAEEHRLLRRQKGGGSGKGKARADNKTAATNTAAAAAASSSSPLIASRDANAEASFLPFPRSLLQAKILPMLRVRERARRQVELAGAREHMLQALARALVHGSPCEPSLPGTFRFRVSEVRPERRLVRGNLLDYFDLEAVASFSSLEGTPFRGVDMVAGDVFEVRLESADPYLCSIEATPLRKIEDGEGEVR